MGQIVSREVIRVVCEETNGLRGLFERGVLRTMLEDTENSDKCFPLMYYEGNILILL